MFGQEVYVEIVKRLVLALAIGAAIGFERSYHGRPAGFRTHALVSLSTALLMLVTVYESHWFSSGSGTPTRLDPTRMAQGIMTGIGFLGAGVIVKESMAIRGLTTAASIWITAAIGVIVGAGMYFPAMLAVALSLGTLSLFRWIERRMPSQTYALFSVSFARDAVMRETELRNLVQEHGFSAAQVSYRLDAASDAFEYTMTLRTHHIADLPRLAHTLMRDDTILKFKLTPIGA